jgi:hypothetical protein
MTAVGVTGAVIWQVAVFRGQVNFLDGKAVLKARNDLAAAAKAWLKTHQMSCWQRTAA